MYRVILLLQAYVNLHRAMDANPDSRIPPPIGLAPVEGPIENGDLRLLAAYATLGLSIVSSTGAVPPLPTLTLDDALAVIMEGETLSSDSNPLIIMDAGRLVAVDGML
jgi:hypothetical protein